jgi:hypothetical protein
MAARKMLDISHLPHVGGARSITTERPIQHRLGQRRKKKDDAIAHLDQDFVTAPSHRARRPVGSGTGRPWLGTRVLSAKSNDTLSDIIALKLLSPATSTRRNNAHFPS